MMKKQFAHYDPAFFVVAAFWNWSISFIFFFFGNNIFRILGMEQLNYPIMFQLFMGLVFAFGVGYFMVSRELYTNRGILVAGTIGKMLVFLILAYHALVLKTIAVVLIIPGVVDAIFAVLFIKFLTRKHK